MKLRYLVPGALFVGMALACGGGSSEPEPPSEKADAKALCKAIGESGETDAETDAALAAAPVTTDWGTSMAASLQEGDGITPEAQKAFVDKIKETKASEESLDCSLIEAFWGEM